MPTTPRLWVHPQCVALIPPVEGDDTRDRFWGLEHWLASSDYVFTVEDWLGVYFMARGLYDEHWEQVVDQEVEIMEAAQMAMVCAIVALRAYPDVVSPRPLPGWKLLEANCWADREQWSTREQWLAERGPV
jgi:hypothetical protein